MNKEFENEEPRRVWTANGAILINSKGNLVAEE